MSDVNVSPGFPVDRVDDLVDRVEHLTASLDRLSPLPDRVLELTATHERLSATTARQRIQLIAQGVVIVVLAALVGGFFYLYKTQDDTISRVNCQVQVRAQLSALADKDRNNMYGLIDAALSGRYTNDPVAAAPIIARFKSIQAADNAARTRLGANSTKTCSG